MHFTIASLVLAFVASTTRVSAVPVPAPDAASFPQPQVKYAPPAGAPPGYYSPPPGPPPPPANTILKVDMNYFDGTSLSSKQGPNLEIMRKAFEKFRLMPQNQKIFQGVGYCVLQRATDPSTNRFKNEKAPFWKSLLKGKLPRKTKFGTYECNRQQNDGRVLVSGEFTWSGRTLLKKVVDYLVYSPPSTGGTASAYTYDNTLSTFQAIELGEAIEAIEMDVGMGI